MLPHGIINIYDSSDGGFNNGKDFSVERDPLLAREVDRLRQLSHPMAPVVDEWAVTFINSPVQADGHNCIPLALAHIWSVANGMDLGKMTNVVGDHLRLGNCCCLLQCGKRYQGARLTSQAARNGTSI